MPDSTISQALKEAYASVVSVPIRHTLELNHAAFTDPIRVVRGRGDISAYIEEGAPEDAESYQTFIGFAFDIQPPDEYGQCKIEFDNVDRSIVTNIELSMASATPITMIYRAYLENDLTTPQNLPPLELSLISISVTVFRVTATAALMNFHNKRFPGLAYTDAQFPSLVE